MNGGADFRASGGLEEAENGGGLVLAWGRTLSRHRRIPYLHLSPVVSGRSTGRWKLAPCQNSERMVASSNAVAAASLQNSQEYSMKGRSRRARAMKRVTVSIGRKRENKRGEGRRLLFVGSGLLSQHRQETRGK